MDPEVLAAHRRSRGTRCWSCRAAVPARGRRCRRTPPRWPGGPGTRPAAGSRSRRRRAPVGSTPRALGCARAGAEQNAVEILRGLGDVGVGGQALVVVTPDLRVHSQLAEILDQVEHEAVVVVDDQNLHRPGYGVPRDFGVIGARCYSALPPLSSPPARRAWRTSSAPVRCARPVRPRRVVLRCSPARTAPRTACRASPAVPRRGRPAWRRRCRPR